MTRPAVQRGMGAAQRKFWLSLHLLFLACWVTGVLGCLILIVLAQRRSQPELQAAGHYFITYLDVLLIVPGDFGTLLTGLWLAWRSHWGLTRYYWIVTKLIANVLLLLNGSLLIRRWAVLSLSRNDVETGNLAFLNSPAYQAARDHLVVAFGGSLLVMFSLIVLSVYKPWGKLPGQQTSTHSNVS